MQRILIFKAIQFALCQLFNFCVNQKDCPDGVCDEATTEIDNLNLTIPPPLVSPGKVQAFDVGDIDWSKLKDVSDAVVLLLSSLKAFFGLNRVGK